jgi:hypothetical protein
MSSIKTYEDLLAEEKRLEGIIYSHRESIKDDLGKIKEGLRPFKLVMNMVGKAVNRDKPGPLLNFGLDLGIDLIVKKFLLAKAGWLTKVVVPYLIKNYSSHFIIDYKKSKIIKKAKSLFKKFQEKAGEDPSTFTAT